MPHSHNRDFLRPAAICTRPFLCSLCGVLPPGIQTLSPSTGHSCSGPVSRTWSLSSGPGGQGSPDGFLDVGLATTSGCWPAGSDGLPGSGTPSLIFIFDVDTVIGSFIIDTSGWTPENHLVFLECTANPCILPTFTAGTVTCPCSCHGDPVCDGVLDVLDVVTVVGEAFRGCVPIADSPCPHVSRNDANCDCIIDVFDVAEIVDRAFRNNPAPLRNPCSNGSIASH